MSEATTLLPPNATPLEKAVSLAGAARRPVPADLIRAVWNADTCPEDLLGWLAHTLSVDIWDDAWPPDKKRYVIKRALPLHEIKGTEAALREYVQLAGYRVTRVVTPPQGIFASRGMDAAQHKAWLASLPEIRLYTLRPRGRGNNVASYAGGTRPVRAMIAGSGLPGSAVGAVAGDPFDLIYSTRREAVLIESGVTTVLGVDGRKSREIESFYLPAKPGPTTAASGVNGRCAGRYAGHGFAASDATRTDYVASIRRAGDLSWWNLARHGRQPVDAQPAPGKTFGRDRVSAFAGRCAGRVFATRGDNDRLIYESWRLAARGTVPALAQVVSFAGHARTSIAPKTAEVTVDMRRAATVGWTFANLPRAIRFASRGAPRVLDPLKRAITASQRASDRVLIDTQANPPGSFAAATVNDLTLR